MLKMFNVAFDLNRCFFLSLRQYSKVAEKKAAASRAEYDDLTNKRQEVMFLDLERKVGMRNRLLL